ncbi:AIR synthase-related protein [Methylocystis parvus]|uniref:AIR synthase-related protein n=1 Tax=Methylocystis parvus TaxID=134 RepID=UPI003C7400E2
MIADVAKSAPTGFVAEGQVILLIGETRGWLGQSAYLADICGRKEGAPPPVDLAAERRNGEFVRELVLSGRVTAAHDLSDGGLAVALAEMALAGGIGAAAPHAPEGPAHAFLFGEDQSRYLVTAATRKDAEAIADSATKAGVPIYSLGVTGGDSLILPGEAPILLTELRKAHETPLPAYMAGDDRVFSDNS